MRRLMLIALAPVLVWIAMASPSSADAPLCALSSDFERQILSDDDAIVGAAVYDLRTGTIWSGGHSGPYALHSVIKPPIAWAVLSDAYDNERELTKPQRDALFYMVAWSQNPDVTTLLSMIGGLSGLTPYYERWGVPELIELTHRSRWGASRADPTQLARLFAALAMSDSIPDRARADGFELLRAVVDNHRWGAMVPERALPGWESLIKTGNFTLPEERDADPIAKIDPRDYESERELLADLRRAEEQAETEEPKSETPEGETPLQSQASEHRPLVRMNSAAIWLAAAWQGGQPRYVVTIMQESFLSWSRSRQLQNRIGEILALAIVQRESGLSPSLSHACIKRALS